MPLRHAGLQDHFADADLPEDALSCLQGLRAVIGEEEGVVVMHLRRVLIRTGVQAVGEAFSGEELVRLALRERPDLILIGTYLRDPIGGLEAARRILAAYRPCVVFLGVAEDEAYKREAEALGACGYIAKPFTADSLMLLLACWYADWCASGGENGPAL